MSFEVGTRVEVPGSTNKEWQGVGVVVEPAWSRSSIVTVRMETGRFAGREGGFNFSELVEIPEVVDHEQAIEILREWALRAVGLIDAYDSLQFAVKDFEAASEAFTGFDVG